MNAVIRKAWADLLGRLWQSTLIALSVAGTALLLYLGLAILFAANSPYEKQMVRTQGAHAWFWLQADASGQAVAERIVARPEVVQSLQRQVLNTYLVAPDVAKIPWVDVTALEPGGPRMMGHILVTGRELRPADQHAGLLSASVASYLQVGVGDTVRVQTQAGQRPIQVVGLIAEPKVCTFPRCGGHSLYVLPQTFSELAAAGNEVQLLVGVRLQEPQTADAFVSQMRTEQSAALIKADSWLSVADFYKSDQIFTVVPVLLLGLVAVVVGAMILVIIIGGSVLGQYREIAILKSIGFSGMQVLLLYLSQTLLLGLVGGLLGIAGGHVMAVRAMAPLARSMGTPDVLHFMPTVALLVLAIVLALALLLTALAAWKAVRRPPSALLIAGFAAPRARIALPVRLAIWLRAPVLVVLGLKDATARPARAVMTWASLTACLLMLMQGLNAPGILQQIWTHRELLGLNWDMTVVPRQLSLPETEAAVQKVPQLRGYYREIDQTATVADQQFDLNLRAVDGDWHDFGFRVLEGRLVEHPGEILLAPRAWERLGVKAGDSIRVQIGNQSAVLTVAGKYQDQMYGGRIGLITFTTLQQFGAGAEAAPLLRVKLQSAADWMAARRALLEATKYRPLVMLEDQDPPAFATDVVAMERQLGWMAAAIACLSILGAALLSAREQMREVGIRKAIGMSPGQVLGSVMVGGAWFGVLGVVSALPLGYLIQKGLALVMTSVMGIGTMPLDMPGSILLLAGVVGMLLAVGAVLPAAAWGARLVTAQVLHAE